MRIYEKNDNYELIEGDMLKVLDEMPENSVDAIVTDPPYHLESITKRFGKPESAECKEGNDGSFKRLTSGFMNQEWDGGDISFRPETWAKCLRVLKPGGNLVAFGGSRTYHRIACAIEDGGFKIRDTLMYLYGTGFPKSHNIGLSIDKAEGCPDRGHRVATASRFHPDGTFEPNGEKLEKYEAKTDDGHKWAGYGTALKPAFEPIIMARKPIEGTVASNCLKYGVGGINIDECRIPFENDVWKTQKSGKSSRAFQSEETTTANGICAANDNGRYPANVITDGSDEIGLGEASRFFYSAKASRKDRDEGMELEFEEGQATDGCVRSNKESAREFGANSAERFNTHPTVKPCELMQYLIRLFAVRGGVILDPFNGSGSTGKAAMFENRERGAGYRYIGIDITSEYLPISKARIDYALYQYDYDLRKKEAESGQQHLDLFEEEQKK